jgi:hypothetical protein
MGCSQAISQDFMLGGDVREHGVQTKSGSAEPWAQSAPAHSEAVLGVGEGGGRPLLPRGSGGITPENFRNSKCS